MKPWKTIETEYQDFSSEPESFDLVSEAEYRRWCFWRTVRRRAAIASGTLCGLSIASAFMLLLAAFASGTPHQKDHFARYAVGFVGITFLSGGAASFLFRED